MCHNLSFVTFWVLRVFFSQFEFFHNLIFWVFSQFEFWSFVTIRIFEFCHHLNFGFGPNMSFLVWSQFDFLSFVTILVLLRFDFFKVFHNLSFWVFTICVWVLSQFDFLNFVTIWFFSSFVTILRTKKKYRIFLSLLSQLSLLSLMSQLSQLSLLSLLLHR